MFKKVRNDKHRDWNLSKDLIFNEYQRAEIVDDKGYSVIRGGFDGTCICEEWANRILYVEELFRSVKNTTKQLEVFLSVVDLISDDVSKEDRRKLCQDILDIVNSNDDLLAKIEEE